MTASAITVKVLLVRIGHESRPTTFLPHFGTICTKAINRTGHKASASVATNLASQDSRPEKDKCKEKN